MDKPVASGNVCADEALLVRDLDGLTRWAGLLPAGEKERTLRVLGHDLSFSNNKFVLLLLLWNVTTNIPRL